MSDIGGVLGLFLGFTVMTIGEFVEYFVDLVVWCSMWICYRKSWRKMKGSWRKKSNGKSMNKSSSSLFGSRELMLKEHYTHDDTRDQSNPTLTQHSLPARGTTRKNENMMQTSQQKMNESLHSDFGEALYGVGDEDSGVRKSDIDLNVFSPSPAPRLTYKHGPDSQMRGIMTPVEKNRRFSMDFL